MTLDSGLIKDNVKIGCKYYELEEKCIQIIDAYCMENEENQQEFEKFAKNYHTFRPYFDFVVCRLQYQVVNPQMEEGTYLVGKENHMYVYHTRTQKFEEGFRYGCSDDITLDVYPMSLDSSTYHDCLVDGNNHHLLPKDMTGHTHIFQQILNLLLISNPDICEEYLTYDSEIGFFVQRYLPLLRFQSDRQGSMIITRGIYRKENMTEMQEIFLSDMIDNRYTYPCYWLDAGEKDGYSQTRDFSKKLMYQGGNHERKRI